MEEPFPASKFVSCLENRIYDVPQSKLLQMDSEKLLFIPSTDTFFGNEFTIYQGERSHTPSSFLDSTEITHMTLQKDILSTVASEEPLYSGLSNVPELELSPWRFCLCRVVLNTNVATVRKTPDVVLQL
ncbi:hypothetical protein Zmor_017498 [Zophobas morio]|uniref:Uncharacterized protein n=1 Tax=Zophobas morio TaxID=2755281 RepID=A0AA38MC84_9CUCU|nr:hypothetical protein Zmor_017498 [Zophobas morio]